jgi:hypothetical protein
MKTIWAVLLSLICHVARAEPLFYVLDLRHTGDAVLHGSSLGSFPTAGVPYVVVDMPAIKCCFQSGTRPGQRKSPGSNKGSTSPFSSESGEGTVQLAGYVTLAAADTRGAMGTLAFGLRGMTSVTLKGKRTYEIVVQGRDRPVIVQHCPGAEGVNFRLFQHVADHKPYATYYYALGYDTEPDCR